MPKQANKKTGNQITLLTFHNQANWNLDRTTCKENFMKLEKTTDSLKVHTTAS